MSHPAFSRTPHILVVDDEPDNFDVIEGFLFSEKYHLSYVRSAKNAFIRLEKHVPDLIIVDAMMPDIDGFSFCRRFKKIAQWQHIPVIMITALGNEYLGECLASGADDFLAKPISKVELQARVNSMLRIKFQYDALKDSRQLRADLTDMVVHDFTNPITTLLLQTEILERQTLPDTVKRGIKRMRQAAQTLEGLRNDFLAYGRAEAGVLTLQKEQFIVRDLVDEVIADFEALAEAKNISLTVKYLSNSFERFTGDRPLLTRVLNNLLTNALKFSPPQSAIEAVVDMKIAPLTGETIWTLAIKDQGKGIPNDQKEKIFQKYRIGPQQNYVPQTGLGLTFCQMVVEAHGGVIFVRDNEPEGSVFQMEIPDLGTLSQGI